MSLSSNCPVPDDLLLDELGELPVNRSVSLRVHTDGCSACQAERASLRQIMSDLSNPPNPFNPHGAHGPRSMAAEGHVFIARVEAAARSMGRSRPIWESRRPMWPLIAVVAGAAAGLVLTVSAVRRWDSSTDRRDDMREPLVGAVAARGRSTTEVRLAAEVLLLREGRLGPIGGHAVYGSDALAVRVTNLSGHTVHVMAFGRDAAGGVHWLFPGWQDEQTNPTSVAISSGVKDHVLDEVVQPEAPAAGPMQFVTLVSTDPLTVKEVEARLTRGGSATSVGTLFPGVVARESTARWEAGR